MGMRFVRWMMGPLVGVAIAAGLLAWTPQDGDEQEAPAPALPPAPRPAVPMARTATRAPALVSNEDLPLNAQVERLLATHDPADAFRAYVLVADCVTFNADRGRLIFDQDSLYGLRPMSEREKRHDAKLCGPMTERERQARLDYLAIALKAGVPGAATAFVEAGPFGDPSALKTRPDDPLVKEWKATARAQLARAADSGTDLGALHVWGTYNQVGSDITEKNPAVAYRYMLAIGLIQADLLGADDLLAKVYAQDSSLMTALAADLSPEQRAAGLAAARRIAELAKEARERALRTPAS
jgi:hypothetical protein